jgi:hypothetical protein
MVEDAAAAASALLMGVVGATVFVVVLVVGFCM